MKAQLHTAVFVLIFHLSFSQSIKHRIPDYSNESIKYDLYYGILKIGEARLSFGTNSECNSAFIIAEARSTGLMKFFKDVQYRYESCMDRKTGLPIFDSRILREDDYIDMNTIHYYHTLRPDSSVIYSDKTGMVVVPKNIYDLLTGFFDFRANYIKYNMPSNFSFHKTTFFVDKVWDLNISYHGTENVKTERGRIDCHIFKPQTIVGYFFNSKEAMTIWVTRENGNIPVKFCVELKVGTLWGIITDYKSPDNFFIPN